MSARAGLLLLPAAGILAAQAPAPFRLPNGLAISVREDLGRPLVRVRLRFDLPPRPAGLVAFALEALEHSATGSHSRAAFARTLDHAGLGLVRTLGPGTLSWELTGSPQAFDVGLALLADQALRPQVDGAALERSRLRLYRELQALSPAAQALQRGRVRLGTLEGPLADEILLAQSGQLDVEGFLREALRPERAHLSIEGAVGESQARTAAFLAFGTWTRGGAVAPVATPVDPVRLTLVPGGAPFAWVGVDLKESSPAFRALLALAAPLALRPGVDLEVHPLGFALRASGPPLETLRRIQEDLDAFARKGLDAGALEAAKRRHAAGEATLGLHPALPLSAGLGADVQAMDLASFNALLAKAFDLRARQAVLAGLGAKEQADPSLAPFGEPEVWVEGRGAFLRRSAAQAPAMPPRP